MTQCGLEKRGEGEREEGERGEGKEGGHNVKRRL